MSKPKRSPSQRAPAGVEPFVMTPEVMVDRLDRALHELQLVSAVFKATMYGVKAWPHTVRDQGPQFDDEHFEALLSAVDTASSDVQDVRDKLAEIGGASCRK
jgi:hypothetical protein